MSWTLRSRERKAIPPSLQSPPKSLVLVFLPVPLLSILWGENQFFRESLASTQKEWYRVAGYQYIPKYLLFNLKNHFFIRVSMTPFLFHSLFTQNPKNLGVQLHLQSPYYYVCVCVCVCVSRSVVSNSLQPHGLKPTRSSCPWDSPGKNTGVGCHALLQGIFPTQGLNLGLPHCRRILYHLSLQGSPVSISKYILIWALWIYLKAPVTWETVWVA